MLGNIDTRRASRPIAEMLGMASVSVARILGHAASATPGGLALRIDRHFISEKRESILPGHTIAVCGTNGKTTVTNMLATVARAMPSVREVACNSEGANMMTGVATALVGTKSPDWGIFEVDELSTRLVLPELRPDFLVLLNLFRDQMDRSGEIDHTQDVISQAIAPLSETLTLVANADDPLVSEVGMRYSETGGKVVWFGIRDGIKASESSVNEARLCPICGTPLSYSYQTYAMMGCYSCPNGDFHRPEPDYEVEVAKSDSSACVIRLIRGEGRRLVGSCSVRLGGTYMAYNLTAVAVAAYVSQMAAPFDVTESLIGFCPKNGRLQRMSVRGHDVILNLAKNPTGFNQNIDMAMRDGKRKAICVSINDGAQDGRDISWIWDIDFENLLSSEIERVFVCGERAGDVAIRMRYAGIEAEMISDMDDLFSGLCDDGSRDLDVCVLCNYTALWPAKASLERLERRGLA